MSDLNRIDGIYVGQLDKNELRLFERAVQDGEAYRSYEGVMGFMGCAKARLHRSLPTVMCDECGVNPADDPSPICVGCAAYREHTGHF